jgi:hypothetical protein
MEGIFLRDYITISILRLYTYEFRIMPNGMQVVKIFSLNNSGLENAIEWYLHKLRGLSP